MRGGLEVVELSIEGDEDDARGLEWREEEERRGWVLMNQPWKNGGIYRVALCQWDNGNNRNEGTTELAPVKMSG